MAGVVEEDPSDAPTASDKVDAAVDVATEMLAAAVGKLVLEGAHEAVARDVDNWTVVGVKVVGVEDGCAVLGRER